MLARLRSRLTYANVMATAAVFIALGGSATAAVLITGKNVKNGSLTGLDVKNNSLGSVDVKDGGLLAKDFKAGQLPVGPQGPKGDKGDPGTNGANGANGAKGDRGDPGPSDGYLGGASGETLTAPGNYLFTGRAYVNNNTGVAITSSCQFNATNAAGTSQGLGIADIPAGKQATIPVIGSITLISGTSFVSMSCTGGGAPEYIFAMVKVAALH